MTKNYRMFALSVSLASGLGYVLWGCGKDSAVTSAPTSTASEVAVTAVSGSVNAGDTTLSSRDPIPASHSPGFSPISDAYADNSWSCTSATVTDNGSAVSTYATAGDTYVLAPGGCSVTYDNGKTASSISTGSWTLTYGASCSNTGSAADFKIARQPSGCVLTRTSTSGVTRTLTGPAGNQYAITHSTNGSGTGYDTTVTTSNTGVKSQCTSNVGSFCTGGTITVNGSHLTGTFDGVTFWDHTVTTGTALSLTATSTTKTIASGTVVVQHNLLKTTSTSTFANVVYSKSNCCFPVSGTITTTYSGGTLDGKTESLTFDGSSCGIGTVTKTDGSTASVSLIHCI